MTGHQCGTSTDAQDWTHLNPWPALVRWWRRRHRIFWIPTEAKRPRLTRAIVEAGVRSPEMMTWALDYRDWTRSRQVWRMALLLASLLAVEMLVGGGVEAPRQTGAAPMSYSGKDAY